MEILRTEFIPRYRQCSVNIIDTSKCILVTIARTAFDHVVCHWQSYLGRHALIGLAIGGMECKLLAS